MRERAICVIVLIILGLLVALSGRLAYADLVSDSAGYCVLSSDSASCSSVQNSVYGSIFGLKVSYFGFFVFAVLFVLYLLGLYKKRIFNLFFLASLVGALFSVYLLVIQIFVLKQICSTCFIIDVLTICVFGFAFAEKKRR